MGLSPVGSATQSERCTVKPSQIVDRCHPSRLISVTACRQQHGRYEAPKTSSTRLIPSGDSVTVAARSLNSTIRSA